MKDFLAHYNELNEWMQKLGAEIPDSMQAFGKLHESSIAKGALDSKTKELIALGIAITVRCDGCISFHVHDAMKAGAKKSGDSRNRWRSRTHGRRPICGIRNRSNASSKSVPRTRALI
tara:strand:- start:19422 stop:19775 length:354 start_codon:yes stop_codon:yes gene_type:complete